MSGNARVRRAQLRSAGSRTLTVNDSGAEGGSERHYDKALAAWRSGKQVKAKAEAL